MPILSSKIKKHRITKSWSCPCGAYQGIEKYKDVICPNCQFLLLRVPYITTYYGGGKTSIEFAQPRVE